MSDQTLEVEKTPEQIEAERIQHEADMAEWYNLRDELEKKKEREMELRNKVVQYYFPNGLKEGVQRADLPHGWQLVITGVVNRKIDVATQQAVQKELAEKFKFDSGELIKYKPELSISDYKEMIVKRAIDSDTGKALKACFDQMLIITSGSPQVKIEAPKKPKTKVEVA